MSGIECFVRSISSKLTDSGFDIAWDSLAKTKQALLLSASTVDSIAFDENDSQLEKDVKVVESLLRYEAENELDENSSLDEEGMTKLVNDYLLLRDYKFGRHGVSITWIIENYGVFFLTPEEFEEYDSMKESDADQVAYTKRIISPRLKEFWYFTVLLCRRLHEGENKLSAQDAYWLGLVDEVVGTKLTGYRTFLEQQAVEAAPVLIEKSTGG